MNKRDKDRDRDKENYVTVSRLVSALAFALALVIGWLFNILTGSNTDLHERQAKASVRSAINETRLNIVEKSVIDRGPYLITIYNATVRNEALIGGLSRDRKDMKSDVRRLNDEIDKVTENAKNNTRSNNSSRSN